MATRRSATVWVPCALAVRSRSGVHPCTLEVEWADGFRFTGRAELPEGFIRLSRLSTPYHEHKEADAVRRLGGRLCSDFEQKIRNAIGGAAVVSDHPDEQKLAGQLIHKIGANVWTALGVEQHRARETALSKIPEFLKTEAPTAGIVLGVGVLAGAALGHLATVAAAKKDEPSR